LELHLVHRGASAEQLQWLDTRGTVSAVTEMRAMARTEDGAERGLVELKAIDHAYPLYGAVTLEPSQDLESALARRDGEWGAVVLQSLLDRLKLRLGASIHVGDAHYT